MIVAAPPIPFFSEPSETTISLSLGRSGLAHKKLRS